MSVKFRLPYINGTDHEQIAQIRSYLYQLVPEMQFAFDSLDVSDTTENSWTPLGLSDSVIKPNESHGHCDRGCYYRVCEDKKHIYVAFNCALNHSGSPVEINKNPLPMKYRPKQNVYAICPAEGNLIARVLVDNVGHVIVDSLNDLSSNETMTSTEGKWIDGYIDYWI